MASGRDSRRSNVGSRFQCKYMAMKRLPLPRHHVPVEIILEGEHETVIAAGHKHLTSLNFQNTTSVEISVPWSDPRPSEDRNFNITVVHKREADNVFFLCGTNGMKTLCCDMNLSEQTPRCLPSQNKRNIKDSIREFVIKEGEPFALVDSPDSDLYITYSGSQENVGIYKFGKHRIAPGRHSKEQHYVGLVLSREKEPDKSKVYAFYREKNKDQGMYSEMWLAFVTRVCTVDRGGSKNILQFSWTSQMNARLSCGHADSRQHFSELVDVTTVHAEQWEQTRIYALFRNEWGMSAVCVYTIEDIEQIFKTSPFKDADEQTGRPRECVADSTNIPKNVLKMIQMNSEMKESVQPVDNSGPLLSNHHLYTHIHVHGSPNNRHPTVLFLSLNNGAIHKVMQDESRTFVIAEYQPFNHRAHVVSIRLDPPSRKLYVSSRTEVVQLNVANCSQYGDSCELCVLARDPYCGWDGTRCTPETEGTLQDLTQGNHDICASKVQPHPKASGHFTSTHAEEESLVTLPLKAKYFLRCPVSSHHAQYTWHHHGSSTSCSWSEQWCLFLVDSMGPEQEGTYTCVSEEMGYRRELAQHELQVSGEAAGRWRSPLVWLCLAAALIQSWC
uniref:Sema domain-containing protein n=1 Tax=Gasterosteus aculeatus aculeatus TaxID=481459 RepID=A0AAQ4QTV7_GASAC